MELNQAKEIINQAIDIAVKKGCFGLSEMQAIIPALIKIQGLEDVQFGEMPEMPEVSE
jgi:hypothetical protein